MSNQKIIIACAITAVVAGGVGYVGGVKMSSLRRLTQFGSRGGNQMMDFRNGGRAQNGGKAAESVPNMMIRGGAISGEVTAKDDKSITIKMQDGSSRIIILSDSTAYSTSSASSLDKVITGANIAVLGKPNSDGSTTADSIEIK